MSEDMVRRVAEAIGSGDMGPAISLRSALAKGMESYYDDDGRKAQQCADWALRHAARAAIEVWREPTDAMLAAVSIDDGEMFFDEEAARLVLGRMIDTALSENTND